MSKLSIASLIIARRWLALVTASMGLYLVLPDCGLAQNTQKLVVPNGTYAIQVTGYGTDPAGTLLHAAWVGRATYSPDGSVNGVTRFSFNGQIFPQLRFVGGFTVNADGSVTERDYYTPFLLAFKLYPTLDGKTLMIIPIHPQGTFSGIALAQ